jgi:hypothetical protein
MRKHQENSYTTYEALDIWFDVNKTKLALIAALVRFIAEFKTLLDSIKLSKGKVDDTTVGKTQVKYDAEDALVALMLQVGSALYSYATDIDDAALRQKSNFSKTALRRMRDMELVAAGNALYTAALAVVDKLADFGITTDILSSLKDAVDAYENAVGEQGSGVSQHTTAINSIAETFRAIDRLLTEKIDPLMLSMEKDNPVLYREYKQTRMVKELGILHKTPTPAPASTAAPAK